MSALPKYREAQQKLRVYIAEHGLRAGDQLPPEADLAEVFGIGRLSLREAIKGLETVGVLRTLHGGGTFVEPFSFAPILENLPYAFQVEGRDLLNLLELRAGLEEGLVARASEWIRRRDVEELRGIATAMAAEGCTPDEHAALDRQFHRRLYEPLDNPLVSQVIDLFWEMFNRLHRATVAEPSTPAELARMHLDIVDAVAAQDGEVAAMARHFENIRTRL